MPSKHYYESAACLNEMGAVWMKQKNDYFTFLLPKFEFQQIKGAINPNKKSIKLDCEISKLKGELTNFKNAICTLFHTGISDNRWEKQRDIFIDRITKTSPDIFINLSDHKGFCIGDTYADGCSVRYDKAAKKIVAAYDFTKTYSEICSLVFYTGNIDLSNQFIRNKNLCFLLKSDSGTFELTVELLLENRNISYKILVNKEWTAYSIPLQDFGGTETDWSQVKEIKFLTYRKDIQKETIEIKDIKIVS